MCVQDSDLSTLSSFRKIEREMSLFSLLLKSQEKDGHKKYLQSQRKNPIFHFLNCTVRIFSEEKF